MRSEPQILRPFDRAEVLSIAEAAAIAGRKVRTMRDWCARHDIGRRIEGQWAVSRVALAMLLDGNKTALTAYHRGDRASPIVVEYFERWKLPVPRRSSDPRYESLSGVKARSESEAA